MKYSLFVFLLFFCCTSRLWAQITHSEMLPLFSALKSENWTLAKDICDELIKKYPDDSSNGYCLVRYAALHSSAGLVFDNKMSYTQLKEYASQFVGKRIIGPAHPTTMDTQKHAFNTNFIHLENGKTKIYCQSANSSATSIFSFEYYYFDTVLDGYDNSNSRCGGTIEKIEYSPNGNTFWIMRLTIRNAFISKLN